MAVGGMCSIVMAGYGLAVVVERHLGRLLAVLGALTVERIQRAALWLFGVPAVVLVVLLVVVAFGECVAGLWGVE